MTATNMCSNFGGKWSCPQVKVDASKKKSPTRLKGHDWQNHVLDSFYFWYL